MKTSTKIAIFILAMIAVLMLIVFVFLTGINRHMPKDVVYPQGNLSQSIFDSQNTKYVANADLPNKYSFKYCPYTVDTPDVDAAELGDNGVIYQISPDLCLYFTEYDKGTNIEEILRKELSSGILINSDVERSAVDNKIYELGYMNGFKAAFRIDGLTATSGKDAKTAYILGYDLEITDEDNFHGKNIYISVLSPVESTEQYVLQKNVLDHVFMTFQFDNKLEMDLDSIDEAEKRKQEEEQKKIERQEEERLEAIEKEEKAAETESAEDDGIPKHSEKTLAIDEEYTNVTLYYNFTCPTDQISVKLTSPDGAKIYTPASVSAGKMLFNVPVMEPGKWVLIIDGDPGSDSVKIFKEGE